MTRLRWLLALPVVLAFVVLSVLTLTAFVAVEIILGERAR